ncbi:helix-turn-helix domain-containing protein [Ammoniphilus resinae]|uniref:Transcriptional regulator with XRE-family HTH domain n=1 Tax=Ammoniphilus resinae TaxID=861532 RepID=A0ABS4GXN4_9BACL|nr:helix-turn-helix transcriptional regulator [Ammoniphilus resinae]MBP1935027.1 transcriptional regulator with XRE-family HTH domain [Ammoniphilus resinae]
MSPTNDREYYWMLRKRKKIKLREIAAFIGVTVSHLSMYENEKSNLSPEREQAYRKYISDNNNTKSIYFKIDLV